LRGAGFLTGATEFTEIPENCAFHFPKSGNEGDKGNEEDASNRSVGCVVSFICIFGDCLEQIAQLKGPDALSIVGGGEKAPSLVVGRNPGFTARCRLYLFGK
jgi:hypothetical protein